MIQKFRNVYQIIEVKRFWKDLISSFRRMRDEYFMKKSTLSAVSIVDKK